MWKDRVRSGVANVMEILFIYLSGSFSVAEPSSGRSGNHGLALGVEVPCLRSIISHNTRFDIPGIYEEISSELQTTVHGIFVSNQSRDSFFFFFAAPDDSLFCLRRTNLVADSMFWLVCLVVVKVVEDMTEECSKYGSVAAIDIPHVGGPGAGVGFVFVKYGNREDAQKVCTGSRHYFFFFVQFFCACILCARVCVWFLCCYE